MFLEDVFDDFLSTSETLNVPLDYIVDEFNFKEEDVEIASLNNKKSVNS